jgi:hypothetical protein
MESPEGNACYKTNPRESQSIDEVVLAHFLS